MFSKCDPQMSRQEFREKRKRFDRFPLCLKHTLVADTNTAKVRAGSFAESFFVADELKAEGNLYYEDGDCYSALELYELVRDSARCAVLGIFAAPMVGNHRRKD